jgi:hypothetical protein
MPLHDAGAAADHELRARAAFGKALRRVKIQRHAIAKLHRGLFADSLGGTGQRGCNMIKLISSQSDQPLSKRHDDEFAGRLVAAIATSAPARGSGSF